MSLQKDETSSSLSKIFDPTIYSMQPLQPNANASSNNSDGDNRGNSSEESSLIQDDATKYRYSGIESCDDQGNILSRKTSTASECTTMSDYTPENTITSNSTTSSPPTISVVPNYVGGEPVTANNDSNVSNAIEQMNQQQTQQPQSMTTSFESTPSGDATINATTAVPTKDVEAAPPSDRVRKISRFVVSPAILTVTNEKLNPMAPTEEVPTPPPQNQTSITANTQHQFIQQQAMQQIAQQQQQMQSQPMFESHRNVVELSTTQASNILAANPQLSGKIAEFMSTVQAENGTAPFTNPTELLTQSHTAKEFIQQQLKKPLGPDHINTLEQLKIELENITHGHMAFNPNQISPEMVMHQQMQQDMQPMIDVGGGQMINVNEYYRQQQQQQIQQQQQQQRLQSIPNEQYTDQNTRNLSQQNSLENAPDQ